MLCPVCQANECRKNNNGVELRYCSKKCQSTDTIQKRKETNIQKYGVDNPSKSACVIRRRTATNIERYGTANTSQLEEVKEKQKATCLERYGVEFASQNIEIQEKMRKSWASYENSHPFSDPVVREQRRQTLLDRYGVEHPILNDEIADKIRATCLKLYGNENAAKSDIIAKKISESSLSPEVQALKRETNLRKYGVENFSQKDIRDKLVILDNEEWLTHTISEIGQQGVAIALEVSVDTVRKYVAKYSITLPSKSSFESQVVAFIKENYTGEILLSNRSMGKEVDILLPELNLAIECNGTYWHSELNGRGRSYHLDKTKMCAENNMSLLHIWEHTWLNNKDLIQSRLLAKLGQLKRLYARKCYIATVTKDRTRTFLNENHIQGNCPSTINIGLFTNENELVSLMTIGKSRFDKSYEYELLRFCNKQGVTTVGGASKLFTHFVNSYDPHSIISYSDKSFNTGNLYKQLGFKFLHSSSPAYYYTKTYKEVENRIKYQKHKLQKVLVNFDESLSEWENMKLNGYDRIWDCGTDAWGWTIK